MADKREIIVDLLARDKSGGATKAFGKGLEDVGDKAEKAGKKAKGFGESSEVAAKGADKLGDQSSGTARDLEKLDREIAKTTAELVVLAHEFANADDAASKMDLSKSIRKSQNDLRRSTNSKGILEAVLPDPAPFAMKWTTELKSKVADGLADVGPLKGGIAVLGAALAPTIGAAISGAVIGAVGAGGIIGGLALVAKDPAVSSRASEIGAAFSKSVNAGAKTAFLEPAKKALDQVDALAARSGPKIGKIFSATAPSVDGLTKSLTAAADALLDGVVAAAGKSGPVMDELGTIIEDTGKNLGDFLKMAADNADSGASALSDLNNVLQNTITVTTTVVGALGAFKGKLDDVDGAIDKGRAWLEDHLKIVDWTADGYAAGSDAAELYRQGIIGIAGSANDYNHFMATALDTTNSLTDGQQKSTTAAEDQAKAFQDAANAVRASTDPVFALLNAEDSLTAAQKNVAEATKKHGKNSTEAKAALRELAGAAIDLEGKAAALGNTFDGKVTPELRATLKAAGLTDGQISALGKQFTSAKNKGQAFAKNYKASLSVANAAATIHSLYSARDAANSIPRSVTIAMRITGNTNVSESANAVRKNIAARAAGGPVSKSVPYWVGENGPELIVPENHGRVLSAAASRRMSNPVRGMGEVGGPVAGITGPQKIRLEVAGQSEVVTFLRYLIRTANLLQDA